MLMYKLQMCDILFPPLDLYFRLYTFVILIVHSVIWHCQDSRNDLDYSSNWNSFMINDDNTMTYMPCLAENIVQPMRYECNSTINQNTSSHLPLLIIRDYCKLWTCCKISTVHFVILMVWLRKGSICFFIQ